ncbi:diguanylate cyclase (GGDEF)-like protein [Hypnocyclicus thermotrophus]|uniref:Diguanylate cyclase (GGDEF)-like protein n=1 Tax=Hypnocyclicus thermotrophus TaxID=1627895 RepID=A0AA46E0N0_9FUSO|nr:GGDEF domain-containing protein [Hypnocyclicus thermotrophus]TDT72571.1 diguanylate cyclase (GGDEF)-like protein [Hypnocyclicus thermotrophus]
MNKGKNSLFSIVGILLFFLLRFASNEININHGFYKLKTWYTEEGKKVDIPLIRDINGGEITLKTSFKKKEGEYLLVFPIISSNYTEVYLNGKLLKKIGYNKNILMDTFLMPQGILLPKLKESNNLEVKIFSLGNAGINISPFLLPVNKFYYYNIIYFFNYYLISIMNGVLLFTIVIFSFFLFSKNKNKSKKDVYFFISIILLYIFTRDIYYSPYINRDTYFIIKKIVYISLMSSLFIFLQSHNNKSLLKKFFQCILLIPIIFFMFSKNYLMLYNYFNEFIPIGIVTMFYIIYLNRKNNKINIIFTFLLLTALNDYFIHYFPIMEHRFLFSYGLLSYSIFVVLIVIDEIKYLNLKLSYFQTKAITDPLTGIYNREYLDKISLTNNDYLVFIDINDLKIINDKYGHNIGDLIIVHIIDSIKKYLNKNECIIRYGGDEFIVVMKNSKKTMIKIIFKSIQEEIKKFTIPLSISYGIVKFEKNIKHTIDKADKIMYIMKTNMKNKKV